MSLGPREKVSDYVPVSSQTDFKIGAKATIFSVDTEAVNGILAFWREIGLI